MNLGQSGTDVFTLLASTLGIGFLSGFRLYASIFAVGAAIRWDFLHLKQHLASLAVLGDTRILIVAGVLAVVEFLADKVPWIDSAWDSIHSVIRPLAATLLAATALGDFDAGTKTILALLAGTVALSTHSAKAATRLVVNHSPEPFTNVALSLAEDAAAPAALWLISTHPIVFLTGLSVFLAIFAFVAPRVYRLLRLELTSLAALLNKWFGSEAALRLPTPEHLAGAGKARQLWDAINGKLKILPEPLARTIEEALHVASPPAGLRCAPTKSIRRLRRSIGYLCLAGDQVVFVTRRMFRHRIYSIPMADVRDFRLSGGLLLDDLVIETTKAPLRFDVFKTAAAGAEPQQAPALSS
ncbi:MAG: DUF4126 domain-containing protein [Bryobacterales bacterium]|nr:DUF4126 domain-containing protein [Bryobacterales bacterium]